MSARLLVAIPLCDYESISTKVWDRRATHYLVRACLTTLARHIATPIDLYVLADRCSDRFVRMAEDVLAPLRPTIVDNSAIGFGLDRTALPETYRHVVNQFFRMLDLARHGGHEFAYFCEQDYLFRTDVAAAALAAFDAIPAAGLLSPFDHPDRHDAAREPELGRHRLFATARGAWKSVSSTNGHFIWRMALVGRRADWLERTYKAPPDERLDFHVTNTLYREGELLLCPVRSLVQHYRLDGSNASPTYGFSVRLTATRPLGRAWARLRRPVARPSA